LFLFLNDISFDLIEKVPIFTEIQTGNATRINLMYQTWTYVRKILKKWTFRWVFPPFSGFSTKIYLVIHGFYNSRFFPSPKKRELRGPPVHIFSTRIFFLEVCLYKQCIAMIHEKREKDLQNMSDFEANMKKI